ncbi:MAG: hypothetical protein AB7Q92_33755 [Acidimicrobiia bacterium]
MASLPASSEVSFDLEVTGGLFVGQGSVTQRVDFVVHTVPWNGNVADQDDPDTSNNVQHSFVTVRCVSSVDPTASLHRTATVDSNGCSYVGAHATLGPLAQVHEGGFVEAGSTVGTGAVVGAHARLRGELRSRAVLGAYSYLDGVAGERSRIGEDVYLSNVTVGTNAEIGRGSYTTGSDSITVWNHATVPPGTVIDSEYCSANPHICTSG